MDGKRILSPSPQAGRFEVQIPMKMVCGGRKVPFNEAVACSQDASHYTKSFDSDEHKTGGPLSFLGTVIPKGFSLESASFGLVQGRALVRRSTERTLGVDKPTLIVVAQRSTRRRSHVSELSRKTLEERSKPWRTWLERVPPFVGCSRRFPKLLRPRCRYC